MIFRHATLNDIPTLASLINHSYRGESSRAGWTTEADLLSGKRIDETGIMQLLNDPESIILIAQSDETILATIHAHHEADTVHFGLFAVEPSLQGGGIGKELLAFAESEAIRKWGVSTAVMEVITHRSELIEYYERRGYICTGETVTFPESDLWDKKVDFLELTRLKKYLKAHL
ncbi:MAG: GNAT family N-acetyltransferase [Sulfuricurvum sp.]